jgi:cation diffusion facilitator family transporter
VSDRPPDFDHNFGHGKIENLSAFLETILLFITCAWIINEAVSRLSTGKFEIEVNIWSYIVVISSIIIDFYRSRALSRAAKKHNSQALEADALHFSTDIWSSSVVLLGLICAQFGIHIADPIAALGVAVIVLVISYRLGKRSIDILLDKSPKETLEKVNSILRSVEGILRYHNVKVRTAGPYTFIELNIHVEPILTIDEAHELSHMVEEEIKKQIGQCEVHIHTEPEKENDR